MFVEKYGEEIKKLLKAGLILFWVLGLFFALLIVSQLKEYKYIGSGVYPAKTVSVSGLGEVYAVPDIGQFTFGINERAGTVVEAQQTAATKAEVAIKALKAAGVLENDIKTENYSVSPRYEYQDVLCIQYPCPSQQTLVGYEVNQTFSVKVRDLEKSGSLINVATDAGATQVSSLSFTIDDMEKVKADARARAIEQAKEKAKVLEDDLGVNLGKLVGYYENEYPTPYYDTKAYGFGGDVAMAESRVAPPTPTGENKIVSQITLMFEIK